MKLHRLAGYGPIAAYFSAGSLLVFFFLQQFGAALAQVAPGIYVPMAVVFFLALWLWVGSLAVVVLDLEWTEHPATSTSWFQIARWATLVAVLAPVVLGISLVTNIGVPLQPPAYLLIFGGVGITLLIHNLDGRRAGLLHGVLPWLGTITGAAYVVAGIGFGSFLLTPIFYMTGFNVLMLGQALYIVWAIWMGVKLNTSKAAAPTMAMSATH